MSKFIVLDLENHEQEIVQKMWQHFIVTNKLLREIHEDNTQITKYILKPKEGYYYTPSGSVRDCGDHYIIARYASYDRVDKKSLEITENVDDI